MAGLPLRKVSDHNLRWGIGETGFDGGGVLSKGGDLKCQRGLKFDAVADVRDDSYLPCAGGGELRVAVDNDPTQEILPIRIKGAS